MGFHKSLKSWCAGLCVVAQVFCASQAVAGVQSPVAFVQGVANRLFSQLSANQSRLNNQAVIHGIVNKTLLPALNITQMSAAIVGRSAWISASSPNRSALSKQLTKMIIGSYANAFASYNQDSIKIYPLRLNYQVARAVRVRSVIIRKNGQRFNINYNVMRVGSSWKIYDFSIEGVSMVGSYRAQFASVLASRGVSGLLKQLQAHNGR